MEARATPMLRGERAAGIALRTAHLGAMALAVGAAAFGAPEGALRTWLVASAATGAGLLLIEASHGPRTFLVQVRGLLVVAHVAVIGLLHLGAGAGALLAALVLGAVGSHLPKRVRKWSVLHGRTLE